MRLCSVLGIALLAAYGAEGLVSRCRSITNADLCRAAGCVFQIKATGIFCQPCIATMAAGEYWPVGNKEYKVQTSRSTYWDAVGSCNKNGAALAIITSMEEQEMLTSILDNEFWLGYFTIDGKNNCMTTSSCTTTPCPCITPTSGFSLYANPPLRSPDTCVMLNKAFPQEWVFVGCGETKPFICERPLSSATWSSLDADSEVMLFNEQILGRCADDICDAYNAHPVTIKSDAQAAAVTSLLGPTLSKVHTGLSILPNAKTTSYRTWLWAAGDGFPEEPDQHWTGTLVDDNDRGRFTPVTMGKWWEGEHDSKFNAVCMRSKVSSKTIIGSCTSALSLAAGDLVWSTGFEPSAIGYQTDNDGMLPNKPIYINTNVNIRTSECDTGRIPCVEFMGGTTAQIQYPSIYRYGSGEHYPTREMTICARLLKKGATATGVMIGVGFHIPSTANEGYGYGVEFVNGKLLWHGSGVRALYRGAELRALSFPEDTWHFFCFTHTTTEMKMYMDGKEVGTEVGLSDGFPDEFFTTSMAPVRGMVLSGADTLGGKLANNIMLDDLSIWRKVLTTAQMQKLQTGCDSTAVPTAVPTAEPTSAPDTNPPSTAAPPTAVPTSAPATDAPPTVAPPTAVPTSAPDTNPPSTAAPPTAVPTSAPATDAPATLAPSTASPTSAPATSPPSTAVPPTATPTSAPATDAPPTVAPPTAVPTSAPDTNPPSTAAPPTAVPTSAPATDAPATLAPSTASPTSAPATNPPSTAVPPTATPTSAPATDAPPTVAPPTAVPTSAPDTNSPSTAAPATDAPATLAPPTTSPTSAPATNPPSTAAPPTATPTSAPATDAPPTAVPTLSPETNPPSTAAPPTATPTAVPTSTPATNPPATLVPTAIPTAEPTSAPATALTLAPPTAAPLTAAPTATDSPDTIAPATAAPPTGTPTAVPTSIPATDPPATVPPTATPTAEPTSAPAPATAVPTSAPDTNPPATVAPATTTPTAAPTSAPATDPPTTKAPLTAAPTAVPTPPPTDAPATKTPPTIPPTTTPTTISTAVPTGVPLIPTAAPTSAPATYPPATVAPTATPTTSPTLIPTAMPSGTPATGTTVVPTAIPTQPPTSMPTVSAVASAEPTSSPSASRSPTLAPLPTSQPSEYSSETGPPKTSVPATPSPGTVLVEKQAQKTIRSTAAVTNPAGGARLALLNGFDCEVDDIDVGTEPLDWEYHPLGFGIGTSPHKYFLGAIVSNIGLIAAFLLLNYLLAVVLVMLGLKYDDAIFYVRAPGLVSIPMLWLLMGSCISAANLLFFPNKAPKVYAVVGLVMLFLCASVPVLLWMVILRPGRFQGTMVPDPKVTDPTKMDALENPTAEGDKEVVYTGWRRTVYILVYGREVWVRKEGGPDFFVEQYGLFFEQYREGFHWFSIVEILQIVLLSLCSVWKPYEATACTMRNITVCIILFLFFLAVVWFRPYNTPVDKGYAVFMNGAMFFAVLFMTIAIGAGGSKTLMDAAATLLLVSALLMMVKGVYDIFLYLLDLWLGRRKTALVTARRGIPNTAASTPLHISALIPVEDEEMCGIVLDTTLPEGTIKSTSYLRRPVSGLLSARSSYNSMVPLLDELDKSSSGNSEQLPVVRKVSGMTDTGNTLLQAPQRWRGSSFKI